MRYDVIVRRHHWHSGLFTKRPWRGGCVPFRFNPCTQAVPIFSPLLHSLNVNAIQIRYVGRPIFDINRFCDLSNLLGICALIGVLDMVSSEIWWMGGLEKVFIALSMGSKCVWRLFDKLKFLILYVGPFLRNLFISIVKLTELILIS